MINKYERTKFTLKERYNEILFYYNAVCKYENEDFFKTKTYKILLRLAIDNYKKHGGKRNIIRFYQKLK